MQHVLIIESDTLLGTIVQSYLAGQSDLEITGVSPSNQAGLVEEIERLRPDVVVLNEDSQLVEPAQLLAILKGYAKQRLVVVSANHNLARVYSRQQVVITRAADLFTIIRNG